MSIVQVTYSDGDELAVEKEKVVSFANQMIEDVINKRVNNDLVGKTREAAIAKLRGLFSNNINELRLALDSLANQTKNGLGGLAAIDAAGAK